LRCADGDCNLNQCYVDCECDGECQRVAGCQSGCFQEDCELHEEDGPDSDDKSGPSVDDMVGNQGSPSENPIKDTPWPEKAGTYEGGLPEDYVPPEKEDGKDKKPWPADAGLPPFDTEPTKPVNPLEVSDFFDVEEEELDVSEVDEKNKRWPDKAGKVPFVEKNDEVEEEGESGDKN